MKLTSEITNGTPVYFIRRCNASMSDMTQFEMGTFIGWQDGWSEHAKHARIRVPNQERASVVPYSNVFLQTSEGIDELRKFLKEVITRQEQCVKTNESRLSSSKSKLQQVQEYLNLANRLNA